MSYSLSSLNGLVQGIILGSVIGVVKDTRSLDYGSYRDEGLGLRVVGCL